MGVPTKLGESLKQQPMRNSAGQLRLLQSNAVVQGGHLLLSQAGRASAGALDSIVGQRSPQVAMLLQMPQVISAL